MILKRNSIVWIKEVKIVYRLFLVNCYLLHVPKLPSQPASNVGGFLIHLIGLNCFDWTLQGLEMTYVLYQFP